MWGGVPRGEGCSSGSAQYGTFKKRSRQAGYLRVISYISGGENGCNGCLDAVYPVGFVKPRGEGSLCGRRGLFGLPVEDLDGDREYFIREYRPLRWGSCPAPKPSFPPLQMYGLVYK